MKIRPKDFRVREGHKVNLHKWPTRIPPVCPSKNEYAEVHAEHLRELNKKQNVLYAQGRHSLLVIFQAMDAAGKDSAIKHVMSGVNPQGCEVFSFKQPSPSELKHDFFWRAYGCLPERGRIGIFNRSYYEEVLITRVHPEVLEAENLPENTDLKTIWKDRYQSINAFERHLRFNGTHIVKIFLHLSKDEQRKRFLKRIDEPEKNWKFSLSDLTERKFWNEYQKAYGECLSHTSSVDAPWYVVPADDKADAQIIISGILIDTLKNLKMEYPKVSAKRRHELKSIRKLLAKE